MPGPAKSTAHQSAPSVSEITAEIVARLGFIPPFYEPAFDAPLVLRNLWSQTVSAYLDNPLPTIFKEQLAAYISRFCAQPYCMVVHSSSLRPLGFDGQEVLQLITAPPPDDRLIQVDVERMVANEDPLSIWPDPRSELWGALLRAAVAVHLGTDGADVARTQLRRLLGRDYVHLAVFLSYLEMCLAWVEANPEIEFRLDQRAMDHLGPLVAEAPGLGRFVEEHRSLVAQEAPRRRDLLKEIDRRTAVEERLRVALSVKDEFIGMVSHELRTPLTVLVGQTAMLQKRHDLPIDLVEGPLDDIARESAHLSRIIDNMLTLARLDHRDSLEREPVQLDRLVREIVADWAERGPEWEFVSTGDRSVHIVDADPDAIRQVLDNLLGNAVKYSPVGSAIEVSVAGDERLVRVTVSDAGPGIPDGEREAIFQLFHRSPGTAHAKGVGIGLTVCRRLIEAHGGTIVARAREGGGTVLAFSLPVLGE